MTAISSRLRGFVERAGRVVALTGAGMSAESGIPTFRGKDGFWENIPVADLASPEGFDRDPARVWRWYDGRRQQIAACRPNAGHRALAEYGERAAALTIVTQNVDDLHHAAGSRELLELHGNIFRVRCTRDGTMRDDRRVPLPEIPPRCGCGALLRPDIVWFGEALPERTFGEALAAARRAELFLVIGTSALVYPAAGLPQLASDHGAYLVEINLEPTPLSSLADEVLAGPAAVILPELLGTGRDG